MADLYELADQNGHFICSKTKWSLKTGEKKSLPKRPSKETKQWLEAGAIVKCQDSSGEQVAPEEPEVTPEAESPEAAAQTGDQPSDEADAEGTHEADTETEEETTEETEPEPETASPMKKAKKKGRGKGK